MSAPTIAEVLTKRCPKCGTVKPLTEFRECGPSKSRPRRYRKSYCNACSYEGSLDWRRRNPDKVQAYNLRHSPDRSLTVEEWDQRMEDQDGRCAICRRPETKRPRLSVDHNHITMVKRGLLCDDCNNMLGRAGDNIDTLLAAAAYLARWQD